MQAETAQKSKDMTKSVEDIEQMPTPNNIRIKIGCAGESDVRPCMSVQEGKGEEEGVHLLKGMKNFHCVDNHSSSQLCRLIDVSHYRLGDLS